MIFNTYRNLAVCIFAPFFLSSCLTAKGFYAPKSIRTTPIDGGEKWYEYSLVSIDKSEPHYRRKGDEQSFVEFKQNGSCYTGTEPSSESIKYWTVFDFKPGKMWIVLESISDCDKSDKLDGDIKYIIKMPMRQSHAGFVYAVATIEQSAVTKWASSLSWSKRKRYGLSEGIKRVSRSRWSFSNIEGAKAVAEQNISATKLYEVAYSSVKVPIK